MCSRLDGKLMRRVCEVKWIEKWIKLAREGDGSAGGFFDVPI